MSDRHGWYVIHSDPTILFAMGIHGQNLCVDRTHGIVIAKFASQGKPLDCVAIGLTQLALREIRHCLLEA